MPLILAIKAGLTALLIFGEVLRMLCRDHDRLGFGHRLFGRKLKRETSAPIRAGTNRNFAAMRLNGSFNSQKAKTMPGSFGAEKLTEHLLVIVI